MIPEIQGHSIAVVSIDESGEISDFSNRCGVAQDYCIAAPGGAITVAYPTSIQILEFMKVTLPQMIIIIAVETILVLL